MQSYTLNRPDGALLCRVLEQHTNDAAGAIPVSYTHLTLPTTERV